MTTGLRERKKLRTRRALGAAALELAVTHGLAEVTVEQIAEAADVSPRTFFNYFSSKEEAVVAADVERARDMGERLAARPAGEPVLASVRAVMREMLGDAPRSREWIAQARLVRSEPSLVPQQLAAYAASERRLAAILAERTGLDATDLYPAVTAAAVMAAVRVATTRWLESDEHGDLADVVDRVVDLLAAGLRDAPSPGP
ncbi:TetR/AcrR family transcriptional regulator [Actinomycetospora lemnae]|uniref:TetR family transcriptional regulator n=1 Tax=Actinomycetospora lemnae TaxID=3019891 RepID=A0ABT5SNW7_9PSEU|nr:TetR family transcriptional regulator [Actinomycetospora sp. DW7H6]MDD7964190.1 TetR family transcriptional regulator [Actinomycetospora sp. DW7H6]